MTTRTIQEIERKYPFLTFDIRPGFFLGSSRCMLCVNQRCPGYVIVNVHSKLKNDGIFINLQSCVQHGIANSDFVKMSRTIENHFLEGASIIDYDKLLDDLADIGGRDHFSIRIAYSMLAEILARQGIRVENINEYMSTLI